MNPPLRQEGAAPVAGAAIRLHNLTVAYRGHPAVHHVSGEFAAGSLTAIVGPNGGGKSTLLSAIAKRIAPAEGSVACDAARIAWLPQTADIDRSFPVDVHDVVALGLWAQTGALRAVGRAERERIHAALDTVGLHGFERRAIGELSAGQFQRVLFARVLLQDAPLILLDEPFNAIDARTTADLLGVIARWHAEGRTVIAVLHDFAQVRAHFERTLVLARRCVAWGPTAEVLRPETLQSAQGMAEGWDEDAATCEAAA